MLLSLRFHFWPIWLMVTFYDECGVYLLLQRCILCMHRSGSWIHMLLWGRRSRALLGPGLTSWKVAHKEPQQVLMGSVWHQVISICPITRADTVFPLINMIYSWKVIFHQCVPIVMGFMISSGTLVRSLALMKVPIFSFFLYPFLTFKGYGWNFMSTYH